VIEFLAQGAIVVAAGWLAWVAIIAFLSPVTARNALAGMGGTLAIHLGEHIPRALVGIALVVRAAGSKAPELFEYGGWFLIATSIALMLAPRKWHHAYAQWWAARIPLWCYRVMALPTLLFAAALAYAAL